MEEFKKRIKSALESMLGDSYEITETEVTKVNDSKHPTLVIREKKSLVGATIYLDNYYSQGDDEPISSITKRIIDTICNSEKPNIDSDFVEKLMDFESVKDNIVFKLVNKDLNKEYLKGKTYIDYMDLAIVFCIVVEKNAETYSTVVVTDRLFNNWDIDVEVLLGIAKENAIRLFPADIQSLESVVKCFIAESNQNVSEDDLEALDTPYDIFVCSNRQKMSGASTILYDGLLKDLAVDLDVNEFIIIPSSIHEVLIIPGMNNDTGDYMYYKSLVKEVNNTEVSKEEILSYNIYLYSAKDDKVTMID